MATDKDKVLTTDHFERLAKAVETIASRATFTTIVEPRPLEEAAQKAASAYETIAASLRTVFEPAPPASARNQTSY